MAAFSYRAVGPEGRVVEGRLRAESRERALETLRRRGVAPISMEPAAEGALFAGLRGRGGVQALAGFTRDLETLLGANVPVGRALAMLAEGGGAPRAEAVAGALLARVRGGVSLAAAMEAEPDFFPSFYVGMVRAGEESGALAPVLGRIAAMIERSAALRAEIRSTLSYPIMILALSGATIALLLVYVIPEFKPIFAQGGQEIPASTRVVLGASDFVGRWGWLVILALATAMLSARPLSRTPFGRRAIDRALLRLPVVGPLLVKMETARFCRMLGTLVVNGVVLIEAVRIAAGAMENRELAAATQPVAAALGRGEAVVAALARARWTPDRMRQLASVGVESGRLGDMLLKVADIYEAEAARTAQRLVGLIAPLTTILLGCLIALMVWSVIGAVLGAYEQAI